MGSPILLLRLEGPLQSWGVRSRWSRRDTGPEPSKSAIIGLLGCAAGMPRPDWRSSDEPAQTLEGWDRKLRFGVRVDRPGAIETDYHTVLGPFWNAQGKLKQVPAEQTWRDYLHDAAFLVALRQWDGRSDLLDELQCHLRRPRWPLFLGRKACVPSRPVLDRLAGEREYSDVEAALTAEPWSAPGQFVSKSCYLQPDGRGTCPFCRTHGPTPDLTAWIEDPAGDHERADALRVNRLHFYDFRRCRRIDVPTKNLSWSLR